jgi:hypothetical protein
VPNLEPLFPDDPPQIGPYWLDARLTSAESGVAYVGHDSENVPAMVILLSTGAASDAAARDRLAGAVNELDIDTVLARGGHGQDQGRLSKRFYDESHEPTEPGSSPEAPWAALAYDGTDAATAEANRILAQVQLSDKPQLGQASGPDYNLPWVGRRRPGHSRIWPLPWPGRHDRAGWLSLLSSWILMLLIAAMAILIAILIFQQSSQQQPPPPVPPTSSQSQSASASSSESQSQSGSSSGSPTESGSGWPSESLPSGSESQSASPSESSGGPSGSASASAGGGMETPTSKM